MGNGWQINGIGWNDYSWRCWDFFSFFFSLTKIRITEAARRMRWKRQWFATIRSIWSLKTFTSLKSFSRRRLRLLPFVPFFQRRQQFGAIKCHVASNMVIISIERRRHEAERAKQIQCWVIEVDLVTLLMNRKIAKAEIVKNEANVWCDDRKKARNVTF